MYKLKQILKAPLTWITLTILVFSYLIHFKNDTPLNQKLQSMVVSDGNGYYAYLPAFFLQKDPTFHKTMRMQESYGQGGQNFHYAIKSKNGKVINKYFPGISLLQLPGFTFATLILYLFGKPITGYSSIYMIFVYLSSLGYTIFGVYYFLKSLNFCKNSELTQKSSLNWIGFVCIFFGTNLFFSTLGYPAFSHIYSFFLFSLLLYHFQKYIYDNSSIRLVIIGFILGFIFLVRPTNILFVFFLLFFFHSFSELKSFLFNFFSFRKTSFLFVLMPFILTSSIIFLLNKWQTGDFFYWSYQGEGFNFAHPRFFETLFSYRVGIFLHNPILFVSLFGFIFMFKQNKYQFFIWITYFILTTYIISSWWCWDYESAFGHRGFSEQFIIFYFPFIYLLKAFSKSKIFILLVSLCMLYIVMRFYQKIENIFPRQKFTAETYWKSFLDLKIDQTEKYLNLSHCRPFGKVFKISTLNLKENNFNFDNGEEFALQSCYYFPQKRLHDRFFLEVTFQKKKDSNIDWKDIFVVTDAYSKTNHSRQYSTLSIYNYYKEGGGKYLNTKIQEELYVCFEQKDSVLIYIWNKARKNFKIKDYKVRIYEYSLAEPANSQK